MTSSIDVANPNQTKSLSLCLFRYILGKKSVELEIEYGIPRSHLVRYRNQRQNMVFLDLIQSGIGIRDRIWYSQISSSQVQELEIEYSIPRSHLVRYRSQRQNIVFLDLIQSGIARQKELIASLVAKLNLVLFGFEAESCQLGQVNYWHSWL